MGNGLPPRRGCASARRRTARGQRAWVGLYGSTGHDTPGLVRRLVGPSTRGIANPHEGRLASLVTRSWVVSRRARSQPGSPTELE